MTEDTQENCKIRVEGLKENVVLLKHAPGRAILDPTRGLRDQTPWIVATAESANVWRRSKLPKVLGIPGVVSDGIGLFHDAIRA
jgi:hypothetical protein